MRRRMVVLLVMLACGWALAAQDVSDGDIGRLLEAVEDQADDSEASEAMLQRLDEWMEHPLNINDPAQAAQLPGVSAFQLQALRNFVTLHGEVLSLAELALVPGWDSATISLVAPMVETRRIERNPTLAELLKHGRHTLTTGVGGTVEQAAGYANGHYAGDNLHALVNYRFRSSDRIDLRLVADKDPAEAWGKGNYVGFHLMLHRIGPVERLVVGRFDAQFGQGLTLWTGYAPYSTVGNSAMRYGSGLKAASAFAEEEYARGVGATLRLAEAWRLTALASQVEGDRLVGTHLERRSEHLLLGATVAYTRLGDSVRRSTLRYRQDDFVGRRLANVGLDAMVEYGPLQAFAEVAVGSDTLAPAAVGGVRLSANADNQVGLAYRFRSAAYHNMNANPLAMVSHGEERGLALDAKVQLPLGVGLMASVTGWRSGSVSYADYGPSAGWWLRAVLRRQVGRRAECQLRYGGRLGSRNLPTDTTLYLQQSTARHTLYATFRTTAGTCRLVLTLAAAQSRYGEGTPSRGYMAQAEVRRTTPRWGATARVAWFATDDYASRLYSAERLLPHFGSLPALYGRGVRASLALKWTPTRHWMLAVQYNVLHRFDVEQMGSGDALIDAPHRQQWAVVLRCRL